MFKKFIEDKKLPGLNCIFWKEGQVICQETVGYRNVATYEPMTVDTLFRIASMTKPVTSVLAMILCEEGKLSYS